MAVGSTLPSLAGGAVEHVFVNQHVADEETLRRARLRANVRERNAKAIPIRFGSFSTQDGDVKLARLYLNSFK